MLYRNLLQHELTKQRDEFKNFAVAQEKDLNYYLETLEKLCRLPSLEIERKISGDENVGAIPSEEIDLCRGFAFTFSESWANHEEARNWANKILKNRTDVCGGRESDFARTRNKSARRGDSSRLV